MRTSTRQSLKLIALLSIVAAGLSAAGEATLQVNSSTPEIIIATRINDRASIRLPKLPYTFHVEAECAAGLVPQSMLLSIADTQKRVSADSIQGWTEITVTIPAGQIAPLTIAGFCLSATDTEQQQNNRITVHGALSAQAALLCSDGNSEQMIYASLALDITVHCMEPGLPVEK